MMYGTGLIGVGQDDYFGGGVSVETDWLGNPIENAVQTDYWGNVVTPPAPPPPEEFAPYIDSSGTLVSSGTHLPPGEEILIDDAPPPPLREYYCSGSQGTLCFQDPKFGKSVRAAMKMGCPSALFRPAAGVGGALGLEPPCGPAPNGGVITAGQFNTFFQKYGPCPLFKAPNCDRDCRIPAGACFQNSSVMREARRRCENGWTSRSTDAPCPTSSVITNANLDRYSPCSLAHQVGGCRTAQQQPGPGPSFANTHPQGLSDPCGCVFPKQFRDERS